MSQSLSFSFPSLLTFQIGNASLLFLSFASLCWQAFGSTQEGKNN
jgi:hypothetical protein